MISFPQPPLAIEAGDPRTDSKAFRRTLGQFATGVTVITTHSDGKPVGVTANSFSSLSLSPPLVVWSIARSSSNFQAFSRASHFAISILGEDQIEISQRFSRSGEDKFAGVSWRPGAGDAPLIDGAVATLECSAERSYDGGDHIILVGRVLHHARYDGAALLYAQGQYGIVDEHPAFKKQADVTAPVADNASIRDLPLTTQLYLAHHQSSLAFERHRREEGISLAQSRVLSALTREPWLSLQTIARRVYLTRQTVEDAVGELLLRGCLHADDTGKLGLTEKGVVLTQSIRRRLEQYEAEQFAGIPAEQLAVTRDVLTRFINGLMDHDDK